jgi:hypothetical protein
MVTPAPFVIGEMQTDILSPPDAWHADFVRQQALCLDGVLAPALCADLIRRAAAASFVDDDVRDIGTRMIEHPQRIGGALSLLLARAPLLHWLEQATGIQPLRAVAGRLAETRANTRDALTWHNDLDGRWRMLGVVINLSDQPFTGGRFDLRWQGTDATFLLSHQHVTPGSMVIFAVNQHLEHRVTPLLSGGPRRVYAGWFLSRPEHDDDALGSGTIFS